MDYTTGLAGNMFVSDVVVELVSETEIMFTHAKTKDYMRCEMNSDGVWLCHDRSNGVTLIIAPRKVVDGVPGRLYELMKVYKVPAIIYTDKTQLEGIATAYFAGLANGREEMYDKLAESIPMLREDF